MADTMTSALPGISVVAAATEFPVADGTATSKKATASQIKTYVFGAGSSTAGSWPLLGSGNLLMTPAAGAMEFDGESHYRTNDTTSGRAAIDLQHIYRISANLGTRGGTIADYFDSASAFPTVANAEYELVWDLYFLKNTAGTVTFTLTNTQAYANLVASWESCAVAGIAASSVMNTSGIVTTTTAAAAMAATASLTNATNQHFKIRAVAEIGTAGNIRLRVTCSAGTITPLRGSMFTARRLPPGNVGTFAA